MKHLLCLLCLFIADNEFKNQFIKLEKHIDQWDLSYRHFLVIAYSIMGNIIGPEDGCWCVPPGG